MVVSFFGIFDEEDSVWNAMEESIRQQIDESGETC